MLTIARGKMKTQLHEAVERDDPEAVCALLRSGVDTNAQDDLGRTPLHDAVLLRRLSLLPILLQYGANPKLQDQSGENAFDMAARRDDVDVLSTLAREHDHKFI
jgi:ankyrin repeat protein